MIANKHISKLVIFLMALAVILCFVIIGYSSQLNELMGGTKVKMEYESKLFDTSEAMNINIKIDEDDWNKMLSNALSEEYYVCDVVINGKSVKNVAIRPKGNTSLSAIAMDSNTDRYSLKLEFDHFVEGQTCYGLDKLILNNNYADATNMKEAVIYDMYQYIGAYSSLYNYAKVSVNGEYWGVYLALEGVEDSFILRNFGTQDGELYKPDSMEMGGGDSKSSSGMSMPGKPSADNKQAGDNKNSGDDKSSSSNSDSGNMPDMGNFDPSNMPEMGSFDPSNMPDMSNFDPNSMPDMGDFDMSNMPDMSNFDPNSMPGTDGESGSENSGDSSDKKSDRPAMGGFSMGGNGANLNYSDDNLDSYSTIWEGEITGTSKGDHRKVVTALKNINQGKNLEEYLDVDNVLKYMAVHTFAVNMDSLSGSMAHNYYLYEYDGQLNIFPWDYNLSLGGMSMGSSANATEVVNDAIDTPFSGTKFFNALLENEEYLVRYHEYLQQLVDEYTTGGRFESVYNRIRGQIDSLVESDPTAFYTYDEYKTAAETLYETVMLRFESIKGQLAGQIPSTDEGQRKDSSALIDASHINLKAMGEFNMGGSFGGGDKKTEADGNDGDKIEASDSASQNFNKDSMPEGFSKDKMPEGFSADNIPEGFDKDSMPEGFSAGKMPEGFSKDNMPSGFTPENMPGGGFGGSSMSNMKNIITFGICFIIMIVGLIVMKRFKRRKI
jgi:spore coat protein CotH